MTISVEPLEGPMGAVVLGLDSAKPISDEDFAVVEKALHDHIAIVVPELQENVAWLRAFGNRFGPLIPHVLDQYHHPETYEVSIIARNMDTPQSRTTVIPAGAFWHSDLSYEKDPSDAIFLYATHLPSTGGDTLAANMVMAYETLPDAMKKKINGTTATHRWGWNTDGGTPTLNTQQQGTHPDVSQPVVRTHPNTRRKALFVSPGYTVKINEMDQSESDDTLAELFDHALNPNFQYRHAWTKGMLMGLDNRSAMHCAVDDYTEPRCMLRMIVGCTERIGRDAKGEV
ncbi:MAG: TauD/TfdA family dioxygenase [Rhodospirillaceae bacterium]|jgi:taurine dioxygenase|nr:TauD/TfdA family dioxygenase [Rhodospirillaceae bacterium]MBT5034291.1 TauD/TfdA family dioxygenase [Rhodospirillaceae bacterium]MBT6221158.1 TauD/TfdA family dioxygenase [Rhodospirillaceae bacterium]MBT6362370.1 TauD/TfdA family dioxygenase [Rhodospirillaceae bacterium]